MKIMKVVLIVGMVCLSSMILQKHDKKEVEVVSTNTTEDTIPEFFNKSPSEGLLEALIYYDIKHPEIVYAQAVLETGNFKSKHCIIDNNLFGLYNSKNKRYHKFNHWTESILAYKKWVQNKHKASEDYYSFLRRIKYASDPNYIPKLKKIVNDKRRNKTRSDKS